MNYDNPAARLLRIIEQGQLKAKTANCAAIWSEILGVPGGELSLLMSRLGKTMELPELAITALRETYPSQVGACQYWVTQVNRAFASQNLLANWDSFINQIDTHSINYLRATSDFLETKSNTKMIPGEKLAELRLQFENISNELLADQSISSELRKYLIRNVRKLMTSIDEYDLTGALPVLDSIDATIGHVLLDKEYKNFLKDTELGTRLMEILSAAAGVVTVAVGIPQLSQTINHLLGN